MPESVGRLQTKKCASHLVDMFYKACTLISALFYGNWKLKPYCLTIWDFFFKINTKFGLSRIFSYTRENDLPHQILYFPKYSYNCTGAMIFVSSVLRYEKYVLWLCHLCTSFYYFYSYINLLLYTYSHFHIIYSNAL